MTSLLSSPTNYLFKAISSLNFAVFIRGYLDFKNSSASECYYVLYVWYAKSFFKVEVSIYFLRLIILYLPVVIIRDTFYRTCFSFALSL